MRNVEFSKIVMLAGLSLVSISSLSFLLYSGDSNADNLFAFFMEFLHKNNDFQKLILYGILLVVGSMFMALFEQSQKYRELDLKELMENKAFEERKIPLELKKKLLAELNYVISIIEEKITSEIDSAWKWEIKLKSALFTKSRLINGTDLKPVELSEEDKVRLNQESSLLCLKEYKLNTGTDPSTVSSIKEKMALYRKHRQEKA